MKSLLNAYTANSITPVTDGEVLRYNDIDLHTGCGIKFAAGSGSITLTTPGVYLITANASIETTAGSPTGISIYRNGEPINGAYATILPESSGSITTQILVRPSCNAIDNTTVITVINTGDEAKYSHMAITVTKIA